MKKSDKKLLYAGGIAGFISSLCCIGPVIIVALGLGSVSTALSFGKYSNFFLSLAVLFFAIALIFYLKKKKSCSARDIKKNWKIICMAFIVLTVFLVILKYGLAPVLATLVYR
jgi:mercuric ion transport protein